MKRISKWIWAACAVGLLVGCESDSGQTAGVITSGYPSIVDAEDNGINDYVEGQTHMSATIDAVAAVRAYHEFIDEEADGICDKAQDGSLTWHGPGYVDTDSDGICDYWDEDFPLLYQEEKRDCVYWSDFAEPNRFATDPSRQGFVDSNSDGVRDDRQPRHPYDYAACSK